MRRALLVEVSTNEYEVFRSVLAPRGFEVVKASRDVLDQFLAGSDLVITGIGSTASSGFYLASRLQMIRPDLKLVLVSSHPVDHWRERERVEFESLPDGFAAIVQSPVFPHDLLRAIEMLLPS